MHLKFLDFLSQGDYQLVNISRILKFLTLHGFNQFGWNDPFLNPLWMKIAVTPEPVMILILNLDQKLNLTRETRQRQKKLDNDITAANCDVIVIFLIYGQFGAIRKQIPDAWSVTLTFSLISSLLPCKNRKENSKF